MQTIYYLNIAEVLPLRHYSFSPHRNPDKYTPLLPICLGIGRKAHIGPRAIIRGVPKCALIQAAIKGRSPVTMTTTAVTGSAPNPLARLARGTREETARARSATTGRQGTFALGTCSVGRPRGPAPAPSDGGGATALRRIARVGPRVVVVAQP